MSLRLARHSVFCCLGFAWLGAFAGACSSDSGSNSNAAGQAAVGGASAGSVGLGAGGGSAGVSGASGAAGASSSGGAAGSAGTGGAGSAGLEEAAGEAGASGEVPQGFLIPAYTSNAAPSGSNTATRNSGREFTVSGESVVVRDLGVWDSGADGLSVAHAVTLFSLDKIGAGAKGTPVPGGSITVAAGTVAPLDTGFRYAPLAAPIELAPGNYAVVAYGMNDKDRTGDGGGLPLPATGVTDAHFDPYQNVVAASPAFPNTGDTNSHSNASFRFESKLKPLRILPYGASITDGYLGTMAGYRGPLKKLLDQAGIVFQYVGSSIDNPGTVPLPREQQHHEGHSGFVIEAGTSGRAGIYDSRVAWLGPGGSQADLVLIVIGTNDVDLNYQLDTAGQRLDKLLTGILELQPQAKIILAQLTPINDDAEDARCVKYNQAVVATVKAHQMKGEAVSTVDLHSAITRAELADKLHPNDVGYGKVAKVWFDAIQALH